jgi:ribosome modulation factor
MRFTPQTLAKIYQDGRKAAGLGQSTAACPYLDDMNNERLDAWIKGFKSSTADQVPPWVQ